MYANGMNVYPIYYLLEFSEKCIKIISCLLKSGTYRNNTLNIKTRWREIFVLKI